MCRRFCSKRWHSRDAKSTVEFRKTIRAVMAQGLGLGIAAVGGWGVILMVVHVCHAPPPQVRESYSWLGAQKLGRRHLVLQATLGTLKETVPWINTEVTAHRTSKWRRW
jgi:hypothetical protein